MALVYHAAFNQKIYLFHPGAMGDGLLALPSIRRLRRHYPKCEIIWIGSHSLGEIFVQSGEVKEGYSFEAWNFEKFVEMEKQRSLVSDGILVNDNRIVGWMKDADGWWQSRFGSLDHSHALFRSPYDPVLTAQHMEDRYLQTIAEWVGEESFRPNNLEVQPLDGVFPCPEINGGESETIHHRPLILIHPGSGSRKKCVSWSILSDGVKYLLKRFTRMNIGLIGGPADSEFLNPLLNSLKKVRPACFMNKELSLVCGLLKKTKLFVGHDSGLSHLAARMGTPSILLFGPTDPAVWAPRGDHVNVLRSPDLSFSPNEIALAAGKFLTPLQTASVA